MGRAQRRTKGAGSVYQDKNGQWWAKLAIGNGRTRRARCTDRKDAEATLKRLIKERDAGVDLRASQIPLRDWLQRWLSAKALSVAPQTMRFYTRHANYITGSIGHIKLEALEPSDVRRMISILSQTRLAPRSVAHARTVLVSALNMAVKDGAISRNVAEMVDPPRVATFASRALSGDEIDRLLQATEGERLRALFHIAVLLGLRKGELFALRWADVDLEERTLHVAESKTKAGRRTLPLTAGLVAELRQHWQYQQEERRLRSVRWKEHGLVFPSMVGTPISERGFHGIFKRILRRAGLDHSIRFHDLRHTAITDWIAEGADPKTAQALAGHSDPQMTMRVYAKSRSEKPRGAVEDVEERRKRRKA